MKGDAVSGNKDLLLAIDQGTQSVRAMIFDSLGELLAKSQVHIQPYYSRQPGWAEQDCDYYWANLREACQNLWRTHPGLKQRIAGMSVTTQRSVAVCLGEDRNPLRPAISWLDQRRTAKYRRLPLWLQAGLRAAGQRQAVHFFQSRAECNWLAAGDSALWARTRHFLFLSGYFHLKLTGELRDAAAAQVGYVPFDSKRQRWAGPGDIKWKLFCVRREQLPELVPSGQTIGYVTPEAAQWTGIPEGLPVYASGADKACEVLAAGAWTPELAVLSYGTTATINTCNARYIEPIPFIPPYPAAAPGRYNSEIMVQRGYWMVNWFKEQFAAWEVIEAEKQGIAPELLFEKMLETTPPGNLGLILQPFWNPGVRFPGPEAKGAMIGFGDVHNRAHMYRAIIEGIAYALREAAARLERRNGVRIERLKVAGGGSQSDGVMQVTADIFGIPAERPHTFETSGLGAAMNAAVGAGIHATHAEAQARMSRPGRIFLPQAGNAELYTRLYSSVYARMYSRLGPLYRSIRRITNYPGLD
jgi:sugar (pentulose or hexulose) kinase